MLILNRNFKRNFFTSNLCYVYVTALIYLFASFIIYIRPISGAITKIFLISVYLNLTISLIIFSQTKLKVPHITFALILTWLFALIWSFLVTFLKSQPIEPIFYFFSLAILYNILILVYPLPSIFINALSRITRYSIIPIIITVIIFSQEIRSSEFISPNNAGVILVIIFISTQLFFQYKKWQYLIIISMLFLALYKISSRSALLQLISYLTLYLLYPKASKFKYKFYFCIFFGILLSPYIIPQITFRLYESNCGLLINNLSLEHFGENFFSGRERLWMDFYTTHADKYFIGEGIKRVQFSTLSNLSLHNGWLTLYYQTGISGLIIFSAAFILVWKILTEHKYNYLAHIGCAFFGSYLVQQNFETGFFQNNMSISLLTWTIVSYTMTAKSNLKRVVYRDKFSRSLSSLCKPTKVFPESDGFSPIPQRKFKKRLYCTRVNFIRNGHLPWQK